MTLRDVPASLAPDAVARIDARLEAIRRDEEVTILLAIESGSRAWGFPSPDSDYDCRFIFLRRRDDYLSLFPRRDVIETPLEGDMDVNGWDLAKALRLLLKGNAVVIEWLTSPIVYQGDAPFRAGCLALAGTVAERSLVARHYLHLGERQRHAYFADGKTVPLKKLFYALRPAAALRWLRLHPEQAVAPMNFQQLMRECDVPDAVAGIVADLVARKAVTRELGAGPLPAPIAAFIDAEFVAAADHFPLRPVRPSQAARSAVDAFFRATLARY